MRASKPTIHIREKTSKLNLDDSDCQRVSNICQLTTSAAGPVMPDCRGVEKSRVYLNRAKKSPSAGFLPYIIWHRSTGRLAYC